MYPRFSLALVAITAVPGSAWGWGCSGHHIVALIAREHLNPRALAAVEELLAAEPVDPNLARYCKDGSADPFVGAATWADDAKRTEGTGTWHYIDIPRSVSGGDLRPYCEPVGLLQNGSRTGCLISALHDQLAAIDKGSRAGRARALRYVIHLVGDLHMPLHVNDNADRGGNCVPVHFGTADGTINLHALWDSGLLDAALSERHLTEQEFTREIDSRYRVRFDEWAKQKTSVEQWAWEVHKFGVETTYGKLVPSVPVEPTHPADDCTAESAKIRALNIVIGKEYQNSAMQAIGTAPYDGRLSAGRVAEPDLALIYARPFLHRSCIRTRLTASPSCPYRQEFNRQSSASRSSDEWNRSIQREKSSR